MNQSDINKIFPKKENQMYAPPAWGNNPGYPQAAPPQYPQVPNPMNVQQPSQAPSSPFVDNQPQSFQQNHYAYPNQPQQAYSNPIETPTNFPQPTPNPQLTPGQQEYFHKLSMAKWYLDEKNKQRIDLLIGIAAAVAPAVGTILLGTLGIGIAGIFFCYFIFKTINNKKEIDYLKQKYGL